MEIGNKQEDQVGANSDGHLRIAEANRGDNARDAQATENETRGSQRSNTPRQGHNSSMQLERRRHLVHGISRRDGGEFGATGHVWLVDTCDERDLRQMRATAREKDVMHEKDGL